MVSPVRTEPWGRQPEGGSRRIRRVARVARTRISTPPAGDSPSPTGLAAVAVPACRRTGAPVSSWKLAEAAVWSMWWWVIQDKLHVTGCRQIGRVHLVQRPRIHHDHSPAPSGAADQSTTACRPGSWAPGLGANRNRVSVCWPEESTRKDPGFTSIFHLRHHAKRHDGRCWVGQNVERSRRHPRRRRVPPSGSL